MLRGVHRAPCLWQADVLAAAESAFLAGESEARRMLHQGREEVASPGALLLTGLLRRLSEANSSSGAEDGGGVGGAHPFLGRSSSIINNLTAFGMGVVRARSPQPGQNARARGADKGPPPSV